MKQQTVQRSGASSIPPVKKASPKASIKKTSSVKRRIADESSAPVMYVIPQGGGVWCKVPSVNLQTFDKETNTVREIRYCPGENSIFKDEQSEYSRTEHIVFREKNLFVPPQKPNLKAFLDAHPANKANGGRLFEKVVKEAKSEKIVDDEFLIHDAISLIKNKSVDELLPLAMSLNISVDQKNIEIKRELVLMAKRNPQKVLDMYGNPLVKARSTIKQAFDFQIVDENGGAVVWYDTRKMIISVPVGQDKVETLTRFAMTDSGASVLSEIERQLEEIA